jgi:hypothetical protein
MSALFFERSEKPLRAEREFVQQRISLRSNEHLAPLDEGVILDRNNV